MAAVGVALWMVIFVPEWRADSRFGKTGAFIVLAAAAIGSIVVLFGAAIAYGMTVAETESRSPDEEKTGKSIRLV
jgi:hypothetical protein